MELSKQVCTLEQSKRLQDLGIEYPDCELVYVDFSVESGQEGVLCRGASDSEIQHEDWVWVIKGKYSEELRHELDEGTLNADGGVYPAFTVAELGVMLPRVEPFGTSRFINKGSDKWEFTMKTSDWKDWESYPTEAEARAAMLIYLLENNLTTSEEVNNRLQA